MQPFADIWIAFGIGNNYTVLMQHVTHLGRQDPVHYHTAFCALTGYDTTSP